MRRSRRIGGRRKRVVMVKNWRMGEGIRGRIMDERRRRGKMNRITEVLKQVMSRLKEPGAF